MLRKPMEIFDRVDGVIVSFMRGYGITLLRLALALTFIWFGALKILGVSPVSDLVAATAYVVPRQFFVPFLGWWELAVGVGLLFGAALRVTLAFFFLQMAGTFLVFIVHPDLTFRGGNPFLLTTTGEFIVKNLVLISAGIVVGSTVRRGEG